MNTNRLTISLGILLLLPACARQVSVSSQGALGSVQEIPISSSSADARTYFLQGQRELDAGRALEANASFRKAVEQDPAFGYAYLNIANSAASTQEFKENLDLAARHIQGASEGERLMLEINRTFLDNDAVRRLDLSQNLVRAYPNSPRAWLTLGFTQQGLNQHEAARESFRKALSLDPGMFAAHTAIASSYQFNEPRDLVQAKQHRERAIASAPEEAKAYEFLGDTYRAMNQLDQARAAYSQAVQKDPSLSVAILKKGHINSFLGNFAEARADYDAGVAGAKEAAKVTYATYRAFTHVHAGDARAALSELATVTQSADGLGIPAHQVGGAKIFALTNAATIALHHDLISDAEQIIEQLKTVTRSDAARVGDANFSRQQEATLLFWESQLAARKGDYATATQKADEHRKLIESDRNPRRLENFHALLGLIELRKGNFQQAAEHYRQADLTDVYIKYHLALALEKSGRAEEAKRMFQDVASWNFNSVGFALVRKDAKMRAVGSN